MLRLRTLGTATIERDDTPVGGAATQRRRIAMLALVAAAADLGITRDKLVAYLWPERDERARHLLNQTIYALRRDLAADELFLGTDVLRLNPQLITSDIGDFSKAVDAADFERAVELYTGPFLDGFHLGGLEEFERWQDVKRAEIARQVSDAVLALANGASRRGDKLAALRWWRRLAELDPLNAVAALGLMRALADSGNRAGALQHAKVYEALVRSELEAVPDSRVLSLATRFQKTAEPTLARSAPTGAQPKADGTTATTTPTTQRAAAPDAAAATSYHRATPFRLHVEDDIQRLATPGLPLQPGWESAARRISDKVTGAFRRRARIAAIAAMVAALVVAAWAGIVRLRGDAAGNRGDARVAERVVVLPFAIQSDSAHRYLGRAVVDLLTNSLEGVDGLRAVGSQEALKSVADGTETALDASRGRSLATAIGADLFVLGGITESNGRLRIEAILYETRGGAAALSARAAVEGAANFVFALTDSLAAQLAASRGGAPDERLARLAATTTSLGALKPYLDGQRAFRNGNLPLAEEQYRRAVTIDSSFALGWFRLAGAATWMLDPATAQTGAAHALRTGRALPESEQALLSAFAAYVDGRFEEAEKGYRAVTVALPHETEGWRGLGEVLFHYNWLAGRRAAESRTAWERVLRADPNDWRALSHLSEVAAREKRWTEVDSLVRRQMRGDSTDLLRLPAAALRAFAVRDTAEQDRVIASLRKTTHLWSMLAAWNVAVDVGDLAGAERLTRVLTDSARRPEVRALAHVTLAHLELARGRRAAALAELDSVESLFRPWGLQYRGLMLALPFVPASREELTRARDLLARSDTDPQAPRIVTPSPWMTVQESVGAQARDYVRALLSLRLGDGAAALLLADSLQRRPGAAEARALGADLARAVRATAVAARDGPKAALAQTSEHGPNLPFVYPWTSPFYSRAPARYERAVLLARAGRRDEAIRAFGAFSDHSLFDVVFAAPAHLERARLLDRSGQAAAARREYQAFIALWRDCDEELRPAVREADEAVVRLTRQLGAS